jgi:hypothetical protein
VQIIFLYFKSDYNARTIKNFWIKVFLLCNDHLPPHVHVRNTDGEARFTILPVACIENNGLKNKDLYLAESIIEENQQIFLGRWNEFFNR